jgi:hypothetical protein
MNPCEETIDLDTNAYIYSDTRLAPVDCHLVVLPYPSPPVA